MEDSCSETTAEKTGTGADSFKLQNHKQPHFYVQDQRALHAWALQGYDLQPDYQSAYREHYSCKTALLQLSDNILWGMERQLITSLVALDLSAAFDTVDHDILLAILKCKYGVNAKTTLIRQVSTS